MPRYDLCAMILVLSTRIGERLSEHDWGRSLARLPGAVRARIGRFARWEDRQAGLFGKLLLAEGLRRCGEQEGLEGLVWDASGRPFLGGGPDLNISHSGNYAVCALSRSGRVGIDVERVRPIELTDFETQMTRAEWDAIMGSGNRLERFFRLWTRKEAVSKADGRGIAVPLERIVVEGGKAFLDAVLWRIEEVKIADGYVCHLATDGNDPEMRNEEVSRRQLIG